MKQNKKTSCNCFKWVGEGAEEEGLWGNVNNVQYKTNLNCHYKSPPHTMNIFYKNLELKKHKNFLKIPKLPKDQ
jgi:hypothetical protein